MPRPVSDVFSLPPGWPPETSVRLVPKDLVSAADKLHPDGGVDLIHLA